LLVHRSVPQLNGQIPYDHPPIPLFRRLGVRTAREIERERYAIKALRGDFDDIPAPGRADAGGRVRAVLAAIDS
jgi:hypothetical protein